MASDNINPSHFSSDIQEFLRLLHEYRVQYLIVGGEAVIYYGYARLTGDVDFFYERTDENANKLFSALNEFWSGSIPGVGKAEELLEEGLIIQFGRPPNRIDLINRINGVQFAPAWRNRTTVACTIGESSIDIHYIGLTDLIQNKKKVQRAKDLDDLDFLLPKSRSQPAS